MPLAAAGGRGSTLVSGAASRRGTGRRLQAQTRCAVGAGHGVHTWSAWCCCLRGKERQQGFPSSWARREAPTVEHACRQVVGGTLLQDAAAAAGGHVINVTQVGVALHGRLIQACNLWGDNPPLWPGGATGTPVACRSHECRAPDARLPGTLRLLVEEPRLELVAPVPESLGPPPGWLASTVSQEEDAAPCGRASGSISAQAAGRQAAHGRCWVSAIDCSRQRRLGVMHS